MSDREKLVEILKDIGVVCNVPCEVDEDGCGTYEIMGEEYVADYLISNGVTVQKWIPVSERLPDLILCDAGTAYSEAVNVLTSGRKVLTAIWDGFDWTTDADFWGAEDETITHWTPVLLPLPEPTRECE